MPGQDREVVVGLDNGGTAINATVLDSAGGFLVERLLETPSRVGEGPRVAVEALADSFGRVLHLTGVSPDSVRAVGLDTPGPASADGVISSRGAVNFVDPAWRGFDVRGALAARLGLPVTYNNDANAAALYAHHVHFGPDAARRSSVVADRGHRAWRRRDRKRAGGPWRRRNGRRVRAHPDPDGRAARRRAADAGVQLRPGRRRRERRLPDRHPEEPAALLADPLPRSLPAHGGLGAPGGDPGPRLRLLRGRDGHGDLPAAGDRARQAVHHRGERHRPGRVLPRRRRGRGGAQLP